MALPKNMLDAQARNQDAVDNGVVPAAEPLTQAADMKQTGIANATAPQLGVSGQAPVVTPPVVAPVSDEIKYGGNRVVGPNGEPNIGTNGYPGVDAFKLGSVANAPDANDAIKRINENQATSASATTETPPLAPGYSVPGQTALTEAVAPKNPLDGYMEFLTKSLDSMKPTATFNAAATQEQLMKDNDVMTIQDRVNKLSTEENAILENRRLRTEAQMQNGSVPLDVAAGRIGEIERQENTRLNEIRKVKNAALDELNTKNNLIKTIMDAKKYDYETAKDDYNTQFSQQLQMMNMFRSVRQDVRAEEKDVRDAKASAESAKLQAMDKMRDDARANIGTLYNNITSGGFDPQKMTKEDQVMWSQQEMLAGVPAGTFYNLASTQPDKQIKTQYEVEGPNGERYVEILMQDRKTGQTSIQTVQGRSDYKNFLNTKKLENEVDNLPLDTMIKKYNITEKEQQIVKNRADIAQIPYEMELKKYALKKAEMGYDKDYADTYELNPDFALGATPKSVSHFGVQYGAGVEANKSGKNQGTDFSVPVGTPVALPQGEWKVVDAKTGVTGGNIKDYKKTPYGNSVLVQNTKTGEKLRMSHLSDVLVENGTILKGGTVVGKSGATGNVTGPHLDLEYYDTKGKIADLRSSSYAGSYLGNPKQVKTTTTETARDNKMISDMQDAINTLVVDPLKGTLGAGMVSIPGKANMSTAQYQRLKEMWKSKGGKAADFDSNFKEYLPTNF